MNILNSEFYINKFQQRAINKLKTINLPALDEEAWRKVRLESRLSKEIKDKILSNNFELNENEVLLKIKKGEGLITKKVDLTKIKIQEWENIFSKNELEFISNSLNNINNNPKNYFELQNLAYLQNFYFLTLTNNKNLEKNNLLNKEIIIKHSLSKNLNAINHVLIYVTENSNITLTEIFDSDSDSNSNSDSDSNSNSNSNSNTDSDSEINLNLDKNKNIISKENFGFWNTKTTIYLERGANLNYITLKYFNDKQIHFQHNNAYLQSNANLEYGLLQKSGAVGKDFIDTYLKGQNSNFNLNGIFLGDKNNFQDTEICAHHESSNSHSSLLYKAVVKSKAHSVFDGNLEIATGLKDVKSIQKNHNLILEDTARAESMPRLKINAENVSCEHGATFGFLDKEILFFLLTRGFSKDEAKQLLTEAFINEVLVKIKIFSDEERQKYLINLY